MNGVIEVQDGNVLGAVRRLLRQVLESGQVDAVFTPLRHPAGDAVATALVKDAALLELADPLAPVLPLSGARALSMLTQHTPRPRIAAVLRSCELRALIELVKLQQASLEGMTIIGLECTGTYEVQDYARIARGEDAGGADTGGYPLRVACQMCEYPLPSGADIIIQQIGLDNTQQLHLELKNGWGEKLAVQPAGDLSGHEQAIQKVVAEHTATRDRMLAEVSEKTATPQGLAELFSTCIRCHNCMTNCPICYCKTCFFKTNVFDHEPKQFLAWAQRKGATRVPADTLLFHLTRMNHMSTSCVGCGLCTSACPVGLPVGPAFRAVAAKTQAMFDYVAGRSLEEEAPVKTFKVDELHEIGEK